MRCESHEISARAIVAAIMKRLFNFSRRLSQNAAATPVASPLHLP